MRLVVALAVCLALLGCLGQGGGGSFEFKRVDRAPPGAQVHELTQGQLDSLPRPVVAALDKAAATNSSTADVRPSAAWESARTTLGCMPGYEYHGALILCSPDRVYD
jgi:hypothetical protein